MVDGIKGFMQKQFDVRKPQEVYGKVLNECIEDIEDIDPNYPTSDELDNMDSFLFHYTGFVDKVNGRLSIRDTIALYAVYINTTGD